MKVISILQPWASLVALGHKRIETRSWNTKYRGELLIHASAKFTKQQEVLSHEFYMMVRDSRIYHCHRGAIIGKVNLVAVVEVEALVAFPVGYYGDNRYELTEQELAFGDYSPGRYGWLLSEPILFNNPIPAKGQLGLWNYECNKLKHNEFNPNVEKAVCKICNKMIYEESKIINP